MFAPGHRIGVGHTCHLSVIPVLASALSSPAAESCALSLSFHRGGHKVQSGQEAGPRSHSRTIPLSMTSCVSIFPKAVGSLDRFVSCSYCLSPISKQEKR